MLSPDEAATAVAPATELAEDLIAMADDMAEEAATFVGAVESVASGDEPGAAVAVLMLQLSAVLAEGSRLGASEDFVPMGPWEPDTGAEPEIDHLRLALHELLEPIDSYREIFDPYAGDDLVVSSLSGELCQITSDLLHGLAHYTSGRILEALWWWQYSYLSSWGPAASSALRAVQSLVLHVRLGSPMGVPGDEGLF